MREFWPSPTERGLCRVVSVVRFTCTWLHVHNQQQQQLVTDKVSRGTRRQSIAMSDTNIIRGNCITCRPREKIRGIHGILRQMRVRLRKQTLLIVDSKGDNPPTSTLDKRALVLLVSSNAHNVIVAYVNFFNRLWIQMYSPGVRNKKLFNNCNLAFTGVPNMCEASVVQW